MLRNRRLPRVFALLALVVFVAAGCRVQIETKVDVGLDGKGTITQGIGFDDAALKRVGDPAQALRADDLVQAGWEVDAASKEGDPPGFVCISRLIRLRKGPLYSRS